MHWIHCLVLPNRESKVGSESKSICGRRERWLAAPGPPTAAIPSPGGLAREPGQIPHALVMAKHSFTMGNVVIARHR